MFPTYIDLFEERTDNIADIESESESDADSDSSGLRLRSLHRPSKKVGPSDGVWAKRPRGHYLLRYTWLPQPLLHNAVNDLHFASSQRLASDTLHPYTPVPLSASAEAYISTALASDTQTKNSHRKEARRTRLLAVAPSTQLLASPVRTSTFISGGEDEEQDMEDSRASSFTGSYEADSTRHPLRQVAVEVPLKVTAPILSPSDVSRRRVMASQAMKATHEAGSTVSALSLEDSASVEGSLGSRSYMSYTVDSQQVSVDRSRLTKLSQGSQSQSQGSQSKGQSRAFSKSQRSDGKTSLSPSRQSASRGGKEKTSPYDRQKQKSLSKRQQTWDELSQSDGEGSEGEDAWITSIQENHYINAADRAALMSEDAAVPGGPQFNKFGRLKYKPKKYVRAKKDVDEPKLHDYHFLV